MPRTLRRDPERRCERNGMMHSGWEESVLRDPRGNLESFKHSLNAYMNTERPSDSWIDLWQYLIGLCLQLIDDEEDPVA